MKNKYREHNMTRKLSDILGTEKSKKRTFITTECIKNSSQV